MGRWCRRSLPANVRAVTSQTFAVSPPALMCVGTPALGQLCHLGGCADTGTQSHRWQWHGLTRLDRTVLAGLAIGDWADRAVIRHRLLRAAHALNTMWDMHSTAHRAARRASTATHIVGVAGQCPEPW